jgi:hypothetical protein
MRVSRADAGARQYSRFGLIEKEKLFLLMQQSFVSRALELADFMWYLFCT